METTINHTHLFTEGTTTISNSQTIEIEADGLLRGFASKGSTIVSNANPIIRVKSNQHNSQYQADYHWDLSALLENIIIQGSGQAQVAIELEDVYNCYIRNITIRNVNVGIKISTTTNYTAEANRIENVTMENVNKGIQFYNNSGDYNYTTIDNARVSLSDSTNLRGVEIGTGCWLAAPFMHFNVQSSQNCTGLYTNGTTKAELITGSHFKTNGDSYEGYGVELGSNATAAWDQNDRFFVAGRHLSEVLHDTRVSGTSYITTKNNYCCVSSVEYADDGYMTYDSENIIGDLDGYYAAIAMPYYEQPGIMIVGISHPVSTGSIYLYGFPTGDPIYLRVWASDDYQNWTLLSEEYREPSQSFSWLNCGKSENQFRYIGIEVGPGYTGAIGAICIDCVRVDY
jgi:hypothetical protein